MSHSHNTFSFLLRRRKCYPEKSKFVRILTIRNNYSSYSRCVESKKTSNGKKKGENNKKNGNRYLAWAYVEAANHTIRCCPKAQKFFQRKMAKSNRVLATKALANKLTKATYYVMRDQVDFDEDKLFG
jgi:transposase